MKKNDMSTLLNNLLKEVVGEMNVQLKSRIDKLNESIENENFGYSGFLSEKVNDIMNVSKEIRQPEMNEYELTKEEMINLVLNFYKEMLPNYYDRAKKVINSEDGNVLEITEIKEKEHEKHTKGYMIHDYSNCTNKVVIPSIFNLRNALTLVHEIGHAMDTSNSNLEKNYTLYNYKIRSFLSETTAVTFEKIFLDYLWNNTNYPKENIASIMTHRYNYLLKYGRYHLLDKIITLPDEYISVQDLVSIMKFAGVKYDDDMEYLKLIEEYLDCGFDSYIENLNYINALSFSEIIYMDYLKRGNKSIDNYIDSLQDPNKESYILDILIFPISDIMKLEQNRINKKLKTLNLESKKDISVNEGKIVDCLNKLENRYLNAYPISDFGNNEKRK